MNWSKHITITGGKHIIASLSEPLDKECSSKKGYWIAQRLSSEPVNQACNAGMKPKILLQS